MALPLDTNNTTIDMHETAPIHESELRAEPSSADVLNCAISWASCVIASSSMIAITVGIPMLLSGWVTYSDTLFSVGGILFLSGAATATLTVPIMAAVKDRTSYC